MDQKLFRELENTRGREKRSTFIEHLIILGLKTYINKKEEIGTKQRTANHAVASKPPPDKALARYFIPHFFVTFTIKKITKATIINVIKATKKGPIPKSCPV